MFGLFRRNSPAGSRLGHLLRSRNPRERSLTVEQLEERCTPTTVTNLLDSGAGSLRDEVANTGAGGIVDFQSGLTGTINLTSGQIAIAKNLTIQGPGAAVITVSGAAAAYSLVISSSQPILYRPPQT